MVEQRAIDTFFDKHPDADWVTVGKDTATVFDGGSDNTLRSEEEHAAYEEAAGESIEVFGRQISLESFS